jgi:ribose transport system substrate-binding protein
MFKRSRLFVPIALLVFVVGAISIMLVGMSEKTALAKEKKYRFGVSLGWSVNDYGAAWKDEIEENLLKKFPGCKIYWADAQYSPVTQASQIDNFIGLKVDAIFILPAVTLPLEPVVNKAAKLKVPVFVGSSYIHGAKPLSTSVQNDFGMGEVTGKFICDALKGKGKIGAINLGGSRSWWTRSLGLYHVLELYPDIELVAEYKYIPGAVGALTPKQVAKNMLTAHRDLDAMWCSWDGAAIAAADCAKELGMDNLIVTGIDGFAQALDYLRSGTQIKCIMGQAPRGTVRLVVASAYEYFHGRECAELIVTPVYKFTKDRCPPSGLGAFGWDKLGFIKNHPELMKRVL